MISRVITSSFLISLGLILTALGFIFSFVFWIYSIPILLIGIFILFNKEDEIEKIKNSKQKAWPLVASFC
jgi:hypothetical protein